MRSNPYSTVKTLWWRGIQLFQMIESIKLEEFTSRFESYLESECSDSWKMIFVTGAGIRLYILWNNNLVHQLESSHMSLMERGISIRKTWCPCKVSTLQKIIKKGVIKRPCGAVLKAVTIKQVSNEAKTTPFHLFLQHTIRKNWLLKHYTQNIGILSNTLF